MMFRIRTGKRGDPNASRRRVGAPAGQIISGRTTTTEDDDMAWARPLVEEARAAVARGDVCSLEEAELDIDRVVSVLDR